MKITDAINKTFGVYAWKEGKKNVQYFLDSEEIALDMAQKLAAEYNVNAIGHGHLIYTNVKETK